MTRTNKPPENPYGHTRHFLRLRKFLLILPLLLLPTIIITFVALGGGKGVAAKTDTPMPGMVSGINTNLPPVRLPKQQKVENKLTYYEQADEDSAKRLALERQDPYRTKVTSFFGAPIPTAQHPVMPMGLSPGDTMADQLLRRINELKTNLNQKQTARSVEPPATRHLVSQSPVSSRIENLLQSIRKLDTTQPPEDPQMTKIDAMLDKIIRIQHPLQVSVDSPIVFHEPVATLLPARDSADEPVDGFYSIDDPSPTDTIASNVIQAMVHGDQVLSAGSTVELALMQEAVIGGKTIPMDNPLFGEASMSGDRMLIAIRSIRSGASIYPVALQVYDLDGLPGIHIPGSMNRDVAKQSAGQGIDAIGLTTLDASVGAQATQAGIQAAKNLMSRKVRLTRVTIPSGYRVLLKNSSPNH